MRSETEIREGIRCCSEERANCTGCPYDKARDGTSCISIMLADVAELLEIKDERIAIMEETKNANRPEAVGV